MTPHADVAPACEVEGLSVGYGSRVVLSGVSLTLHRGELWGVLGPNGAGKSALVRTLMGLLSPRAGEVRLFGRRSAAWTPAELAKRVAWVPQRFEPMEGLSGLELVLMGRAPFRGSWQLSSASDVARAESVLESLGASSLASRPCEQLSGGEQRLLLLARALVQEPQLLLLDEPTAFLDLRHQVQALGELRRRIDGGLAGLTVLHDVNLAVAYCDRVLLVRDGRALAAGRVNEVLRADRLSELYDVAMLEAPLGSQTFFSPRWRG